MGSNADPVCQAIAANEPHHGPLINVSAQAKRITPIITIRCSDFRLFRKPDFGSRACALHNQRPGLRSRQPAHPGCKKAPAIQFRRTLGAGARVIHHLFFFRLRERVRNGQSQQFRILS